MAFGVSVTTLSHNNRRFDIKDNNDAPMLRFCDTFTLCPSDPTLFLKCFQEGNLLPKNKDPVQQVDRLARFES